MESQPDNVPCAECGSYGQHEAPKSGVVGIAKDVADWLVTHNVSKPDPMHPWIRRPSPMWLSAHFFPHPDPKRSYQVNHLKEALCSIIHHSHSRATVRAITYPIIREWARIQLEDGRMWLRTMRWNERSKRWDGLWRPVCLSLAKYVYKGLAVSSEELEIMDLLHLDPGICEVTDVEYRPYRHITCAPVTFGTAVLNTFDGEVSFDAQQPHAPDEGPVPEVALVQNTGHRQEDPDHAVCESASPNFEAALAYLITEMTVVIRLADPDTPDDEKTRLLEHADAPDGWPKRVAGRVNISGLATAVYRVLTTKHTVNTAPVPPRSKIALAYGHFMAKRMNWTKNKTSTMQLDNNGKRAKVSIVVYEFDPDDQIF